jgi:hypothetical protein
VADQMRALRTGSFGDRLRGMDWISRHERGLGLIKGQGCRDPEESASDSDRQTQTTRMEGVGFATSINRPALVTNEIESRAARTRRRVNGKGRDGVTSQPAPAKR